MTGTLTLRDADSPPGPVPLAARLAERLALALLLAFLAVIALLPDEALLRPKVVWGRSLMECAVGALLVSQAIAGRLRARWPIVLCAATLPALLALMHTLGRSDLSSRSMAEDEVARLLLLPASLWVVSACLSTPGRRRLVVGTLLLLLVPVAAYALAQNLAYELGLPINRVERPPSTFGNPVFLGAFLVLTTPLAMAEALYGRGSMRWVGAVAAGLALPAMLATQSRWAWLGCAVTIAAGMLLLAPSPLARHRLMAGLILAGLGLMAMNLQVVGRPQRHALIWRDTWTMVEDAPWGIGPGQFPLAFLPYASAELLEAYPRAAYIVNDAHSEPLQILAELGWAGLLAVLGMLALVVRAGRRALAAHPLGSPDRPLLVAALATPLGAAVQSLGSPDLRFIVSTLMLGTVLGVAGSFGRESTLHIRGGWPARLVPLGLGLGLIAWTVPATLRRSELAELLSPATTQEPAVPPSPDEIAGLRSAAAEDSGSAERQYALGVALAATRDYVAAAEAFRRTALLAPGNPAVIRSLGVAEGLSGQFQGASMHFRAALAARPDDHEVRYLLAFVAWRRGDIDTAVAELEHLLRDVPGHRQGRLLLERLRE